MKTCNNCNAENQNVNVPYLVHETAMARNERAVKRLIIALIAAIVLMFASNAIWLYCWNSYDYISEEVTVDSDDGGNANYIGNDSDIINGEDSRP